MKLKKLQLTFLAVATAVCNIASAQLFVDNATFTIQSGATVTVQGDVTSNVDIQGAGKIILKGTANQNVNMNGFTVPNVEVDNTSNVTLTGAAKIGTSLLFTNGKILLGTNNLTLSDVATTSGGGTNKFVETNGTGQLLKTLTANVTTYEMPVGAGTSYKPAFVTTTGTYSSANVGVRVLAASHPSKPTKISDYIAAYWPITRTGVTGTVTVAGQYIDAADVTGTEANLRGYFFNGTEWSSTGGTNDAALNRVAAPIAASGTLYGMDKFVYVKAKAFLQGAYPLAGGGIMTDGLRTLLASSVLSDPYRVAPYNTRFTHVNNSVTEVAAATVFATQANTNDNIVDWVFLELRTNGTNPGNVVSQTRSALIKRDGNIVDIDGVSPVTFNNTVNGSYTIAVRHRNHLGFSADPTTNLLAVGEQKATATLLDLTTATDAQIFGPATAYKISTDGKNLLWAGNAFLDTKSAYTGPNNDKDYLLSAILGGIITTPVNGYSVGDFNLDRTAKYTGPGNDKDFLLSTVLSGVATTPRNQSLPQ